MMRYIGKRFVLMLFSIWLIASLTFVLMHWVPGSPFDGEQQLSAAVEQNLRHFYHLDEPQWLQYLYYMKALLTLDFGPTISLPDTSVNTLLWRGFPISFELGILAIGVALVSGLSLGVLSAVFHQRWIDWFSMTLAVLGLAIPNFVLATLLIQELSVNLGWFPVATWQSPWHKVLPTLALATAPMAIIARLTRASVLDVLRQDYIRTAQAKGLSTVAIVVRHVLPNALLPVVTVLGTLLASILTGTFVLEKIFAIPGMGRYFVDSIVQRDYPVIMGTTVFYSAVLVFMLFLVDVVYMYLDPRIRLGARSTHED